VGVRRRKEERAAKKGARRFTTQGTSVAIHAKNPLFAEERTLMIEEFTFLVLLVAIQSTANRHVSNAFGLIGVFILFPLGRASARPHPT
jgi:hypothetical protein